jgi:thioredoxin 1
MSLKHVGPSLFKLVIVGAVLGWKDWQQQSASITPSSTQVEGPAVILFRGDNSPSCQAIHRLVDEAAARHGKQIHFAQLDWSADNPLIKHYQIRFLPTVVFVDRHDKEVGRIVGESPAVQQKLAQALAQIDDLLRQ